MIQLELEGFAVESPSSQTSPPTTPQGKPRGFAAMDREVVRAIASKGGRAAQKAGRAHRFTSEEASAAGKKGGNAPHRRRGRGPVR